MPPAFEFGGQERVNDIEGKAKADHAGADGQHVGVIMLADHPGREGVHAHATAHAFDLIGRHHNALACTAQKNAKPILPRGNELSGLCTPFGIGRAFSGHGADVIHFPALRGHMVEDRPPQLNRGVITGEDEAFWLGHQQGLFAVMVADAGLDALQSGTPNSELIAVIGVAGQLSELSR